MKAKVHVFLKPGVLDVEGKAIEGALHGLGWADVANVRVGKTIEFEAPGSDRATLEADAKAMAEWRFASGDGGGSWRGMVNGPDRLRFLGVLARYAGLIAGIEMK